MKILIILTIIKIHKGKINYTINLLKDDIVDVRIFDITGRIILKQNKLELVEGNIILLSMLMKDKCSDISYFLKIKILVK